MKYKDIFKEALAKFAEEYKILFSAALPNQIVDFSTFSVNSVSEHVITLRCVIFDNAFVLEYTLGEANILIYNAQITTLGIKKILFEIPADAKPREILNALNALCSELHKMDLLEFSSNVFNFRGGASVSEAIARQKEFIANKKAETRRFEILSKKRLEAQTWLQQLGIFEEVAHYYEQKDTRSAIKTIRLARIDKGYQDYPDTKIEQFLKIVFG